MKNNTIYLIIIYIKQNNQSKLIFIIHFKMFSDFYFFLSIGTYMFFILKYYKLIKDKI